MNKPASAIERPSLGNPWANPLSKKIRTLFIAWFVSFACATGIPRIILISKPLPEEGKPFDQLERPDLWVPTLIFFLIALSLSVICARKTWKNRGELRRRVKSLGLIPILIMAGGVAAAASSVIVHVISNSQRH